MINNKKILLLLILILVMLFLRDVPYLNVFFINKLWIFYPLFLFFLFSPKNPIYFFYATLLFMFLALFFVFFKLLIGAEILGVIIYFLVLIILGFKIYSLIKSS